MKGGQVYRHEDMRAADGRSVAQLVKFTTAGAMFPIPWNTNFHSSSAELPSSGPDGGAADGRRERVEHDRTSSTTPTVGPPTQVLDGIDLGGLGFVEQLLEQG
jgi:hypothetical protein